MLDPDFNFMGFYILLLFSSTTFHHVSVKSEISSDWAQTMSDIGASLLMFFTPDTQQVISDKQKLLSKNNVSKRLVKIALN